MTEKTGKPINRKKLAATIVVASAVVATGYDVNRLSADPVGEKDCEPISTYSPDASVNTGDIHVEVSPLPVSAMLQWKQKGGSINDVSCLNRTPVYGIVQITSVDDIQNAVLFAKENKLKVSMAGVRHSMGGQAFYKNNLVLDMLKFNQMSLDEANRILTVQSGATWHDIQDYLHPRFAVKAMQSSDIFSVGGSISVNAHGMDHLAGSVGSSIRSMRVMLADGSIVNVSREEHPELFRLVVGGYGLFGIILDVDLEIVDNDIYETERQIVKYRDFPEIFENEILPNPNLGLFYGHLSTAPGSLLEEMIFYEYTKVEIGDADIPPLGEVSSTKLRRYVLNFSKKGSLAMSIKWFLEKNVEPMLESCTVVPRTQAMGEGEACLVSRNEPMHDSVKYINNNLKNETDILHEYFIPRDQFIPFVDGLREIVRENKVNLLNASVRVIHPEDNFLTYAPDEMYSIVLYINQPVSAKGNDHMIEVTRKLIDLTAQVNGRFFLPYQLHYTPEQLQRSYPEIADFFAAKKVYDPAGLFTNTWYEKYSKLIQ
ncbi:MAG: FAD-binding oxidoreductase [Anaerolineales bacterium]|nr:MAG: FAD-binding oxidoreductase [Anaerolineales bacterium]